MVFADLSAFEMSAIFPKWTNWLPLVLALVAALAGGAVTAGVVIYVTPKYYRVGYQPVQPVPFSHKIHAGQLGLDCRYCHSNVDKSWVANIPSASTCMNCHNQVLKDDPRLAIVRESATNNTPIPWVQIHIVPDYVYFNHSVHVRRGVGCVSCHGQINEMPVVRHAEPLSMSWCLECHRAPEAALRPVGEVTNMNWKPDGEQRARGSELARAWNVQPPKDCSGCHR